MNVKWMFNKCRRYEARLSLLAADALAATERDEVAVHVATCVSCKTKVAELRRLAGDLTRLGERLPQVEPSAALRRRWVTQVRESARRRHEPETPLLPAWLSGRRLAWGSLAAMWTLILFFRFSATEAPKPVVATASPLSLREVWLALKVEARETRFRADANRPARDKSLPPEDLPPRSQSLPARPGDSEVA